MADIRAQDETALASVKAIYDAANQANSLLDQMEQYAEDAGTSLTGIYADAESAKTSAESATQSADIAFKQLSIVENVVGVLDLISKHGNYQVTTDTEVIPDKWYFTRSGTSPDYVYTVVTNPDVADIGTYYELVDIDAAVKDYVTSRLSVTADGLWIQDPSMATKILLSAADGVVLYGPNGSVIGKYGATAQIGDAAGFHIEMDGTELGFYQATRKVAYISNNQLYITQSVVLQQMDLGITVNDGGLGQWSWKVHANGATPPRNNLNLKWNG